MWSAHLPWAKFSMTCHDVLFHYVECVICCIVNGKPFIGPKWDTLKEDGGKRKVDKGLPHLGNLKANGISQKIVGTYEDLCYLKHAHW